MDTEGLLNASGVTAALQPEVDMGQIGSWVVL